MKGFSTLTNFLKTEGFSYQNHADAIGNTLLTADKILCTDPIGRLAAVGISVTVHCFTDTVYSAIGMTLQARLALSGAATVLTRRTAAGISSTILLQPTTMTTDVGP